MRQCPHRLFPSQSTTSGQKADHALDLTHSRPIVGPAAGHQRRTRRAYWPHRRHPHLRLGRAQLRRIRARGRAHAAHPAGRGGRALHRSGQRGHRRPAHHRLLQLPPDHRRVSAGRRVLHGCLAEPGRGSGTAGRRGADDRLHPHRRRGNLGRRRCAHLRGSWVAAVHARTLSGRAADSYAGEHARRARHRRRLHDSHLPVHGHAADCDCRGRLACTAHRRRCRWQQPCSAGGSSSRSSLPAAPP